MNNNYNVAALPTLEKVFMNECFKNHKTQEPKLLLFIFGFYGFKKANTLCISEIQNQQVYP